MARRIVGMINRTKSAPSGNARIKSAARSASHDNDLLFEGSDIGSSHPPTLISSGSPTPATTAPSSTASFNGDEELSSKGFELNGIDNRYRNFPFNPDEFDMTCQRQYLKEGPVTLSAGVQQQDRYLFLFTDILLVAKQRDESNFKVKENVRLCEVWLSVKCVDEVAEASLAHDRSFVIGWPTTNYVATFRDKHERDEWYHQLSQGVATVKEKEFPKVTTVQIHNKQIKSSEIPPVVCHVNHLQSSVDVLRIALEMFDISGTEATSQYQLWVISSKENAAYPLYGHEIPFSIFLSHVRDQMQSGKVDFSDLHQLENLATNPPCEIRCHFVIKPKKSGGGKLRSRVDKIRKKILPSRVDSIDSALSHSPPSSQKHPSGLLFGQPLDSVTTGGRCNASLVPAPVMNMIRCLFEYGLYTEGIFRRTPKTSSVKELRNKLDLGEDVVFDHVSPHLTASLLKEYLRTLPESLLVYDRLQSWLQMLNEPNKNKKVDMAKQLLIGLPLSHMELLRHLICLLHHIALNQDSNKMNAANLAICFGFGLLLPPARSDEEVGRTAKRVSEITQFLIENGKELFGAATLSLLGPPPDPNTVVHDSSEESDFIGSCISKTTTSVDSFPGPGDSPQINSDPTLLRRRPVSSYNVQLGPGTHQQNSSQDSGLADTGSIPSTALDSADFGVMSSSAMTSSYSETYRSCSMSETDNNTEDENFEQIHRYNRYRHCQHPSTSSSCESSGVNLQSGALLRQQLPSTALYNVGSQSSHQRRLGSGALFTDRSAYPEQSFILAQDSATVSAPSDREVILKRSGYKQSEDASSTLSPLTRRLNSDAVRRPPNHKFSSATLPGGLARRSSISETATAPIPRPGYSSSARVGRQAAGRLEDDIDMPPHDGNSMVDHMTISSVDSLYNSAESSTSIDSRFGHLRNSKRMNVGTLKRSESGEHLFIHELIEVDASESSSPSPPQTNKQMLKRAAYHYHPRPPATSPGSTTSGASHSDSRSVERNSCEKTSSCDSSYSNVTSKSGSSQCSPSSRPEKCTCSESTPSLGCELHSSYELYINNPKSNVLPLPTVAYNSAAHTQASSGGSLSLSCVSENDQHRETLGANMLSRLRQNNGRTKSMQSKYNLTSPDMSQNSSCSNRSDCSSQSTNDSDRSSMKSEASADSESSPTGSHTGGIFSRSRFFKNNEHLPTENKFDKPPQNTNGNDQRHNNSSKIRSKNLYSGLVQIDSVDSSTVTESSDDSTPHVSRESSRAQDFADTASEMFGVGNGGSGHSPGRLGAAKLGVGFCSPDGRNRSTSDTIDELSIFVETQGVGELTSGDNSNFMNSGGLVLSSERSTPRAMSRSSSGNDANDVEREIRNSDSTILSDDRPRDSNVSYRNRHHATSPDGVFKAMPVDAVSTPKNGRRYGSLVTEVTKSAENNNSKMYSPNTLNSERNISPRKVHMPAYGSDVSFGPNIRSPAAVFSHQYTVSTKGDNKFKDTNFSFGRDIHNAAQRYSSGIDNNVESRYEKYRGSGLLNKPTLTKPGAIKLIPTYEEALKRRSITIAGISSENDAPVSLNRPPDSSDSDRSRSSTLNSSLSSRFSRDSNLLTTSAVDFLPRLESRFVEQPTRPARRSEPINNSSTSDVHKLLIPVFPKGKVKSRVSKYDRNGPRRKTIGGCEVVDENNNVTLNRSSTDSGSADNLNKIGKEAQRHGNSPAEGAPRTIQTAADIARRLNSHTSKVGKAGISDESSVVGNPFRSKYSPDHPATSLHSGHEDVKTGLDSEHTVRSTAAEISWSVEALRQKFIANQQQNPTKDQQRTPWARDRGAHDVLQMSQSAILPKPDHYNSLTRTPRQSNHVQNISIPVMEASSNSSGKPGFLLTNRGRDSNDSLHSARERSFTYSDELSKRRFAGASNSGSSVRSTNDLNSPSSESSAYRQSYGQAGSKTTSAQLNRLSPQINYPVIKPPPLTSSSGQFSPHKLLQLSSPNGNSSASNVLAPDSALVNGGRLLPGSARAAAGSGPRRYGSVNVIKADYSSEDSKEYKKRMLPPAYKKGSISYV